MIECKGSSTYQMIECKGRSQKIKMEIKDGICHEGGGARGGLEGHIPILKHDFFKKHLESFPDCENVFST